MHKTSPLVSDITEAIICLLNFGRRDAYYHYRGQSSADRVGDFDLV